MGTVERVERRKAINQLVPPGAVKRSAETRRSDAGQREDSGAGRAPRCRDFNRVEAGLEAVAAGGAYPTTGGELPRPSSSLLC